MIVAAIIMLLELTGPSGQKIDINPKSIVSLREPRTAEHFATGTKCLINTSDGKILTVQETCEHVHDMIGGNHEDRHK